MRTAVLLAILLTTDGAEARRSQPLTNAQLLGFNQQFVEAQQFSDNVFLYEEAIDKAEKQARRFEGRSVEIVVQVDQVEKSRGRCHLLSRYG